MLELCFHSHDIPSAVNNFNRCHQARGLTVFISDLRNCANPDQEKKRVEKEMAHIRSKFTTETNMNGARRRRRHPSFYSPVKQPQQRYA